MDNHGHHHHFMPGADLHQLMNGRHPHFQPMFQPPELFPGQPRGLPFEMMQIVGRQELMPGGGGLPEFPAESAAAATAGGAITSASTPSASGFDGDGAGFGGDSGTGRWPRQETLTLLEIRSQLDSKFKEANQKGPLWDEISRIMSEEHGYQRSGKKCREKFENLYKYYKKTKEGRAGRQDGKHYRFFRQLDALYGDSTGSVIPVSDQPHHHQTDYSTSYNVNNPSSKANKLASESLNLSNSSELDSSSLDGNDERRRKRGSWKGQIKELINEEMKKLMERQEAWLDKLTKRLEEKEQERLVREEEWRKQEMARAEREHRLWAKERAWIESRNTALMDALQALTGREHQLLRASSRAEEEPAKKSSNCRKQKEGSRSCGYNSEGFGDEPEIGRDEGNDHGSSNVVADSCLRMWMGEGDLWENYGLNINRGEN